jgi:hypothetical protein
MLWMDLGIRDRSVLNNFCILKMFKIPVFYQYLKIKNTAVILPVVLYGCETRSPILREEQKWSVFESRVLIRMFTPEGEEYQERNEELHNLYSSPDIISVIR